MRYCDKCGVTIAGEEARCPLCQSMTLPRGGDSRPPFPDVPTLYARHGLFFRILLLCTVGGAVACLGVDWALGFHGWSLFVAGGVACLWLLLYISIARRRNVLKALTQQVVVVCALGVLWDLCTGWRAWSIDYLLPAAFMSVMLAMFILTLVLRMPSEAFLIYLLLDMLFGLLPAALLAAGLCRNAYPSIACVCVSVIAFVALLVFKGGAVAQELKRRLHL